MIMYHQATQQAVLCKRQSYSCGIITENDDSYRKRPRKTGQLTKESEMTFSYYSAITFITIASLAVLCVLVHDNGRIEKKQKKIFYLTYLLIGLAAIAEWAGIQLNGSDSVPRELLLAIKCCDYILTPLAGGALIKEMGIKNRGVTVLNCVLIGNTVFQIIAVFFGWMTVIDSNHDYHHGPLYFIYIILYLIVIGIVIIEFLIYGKGFARQNRKSLYSVMSLVIVGILMQEILGKEIRTAYISMTIGAALLFIHYVEYAQLDAEDHINKQRELLHKDTLTGLLSRYAYSKELNKYDAQGVLPDDLAAFSIDINGLKAANDALGHAAGDELIRGAADIISKVFGPYGLCFRTGGDEYIVLAHTDRQKAEELIGQLISEADAWDGKLIHRLSLSAGYALALDHKGVTAEKLIIFADKGMYSEKNEYYRQFEKYSRS